MLVMPDEASQPPQPPATAPRPRVRRSDLIEVCLIATLPLLALFGEFGPASELAHARSGDLEVGIDYPSRARFDMPDRVDAHVTNVGNRTFPEVRLAFDDGDLQTFSGVGSTPETKRAQVMQIQNLGPGETRLVPLALKADRHGRNRGRVTVSARSEPMVLDLGTLVFP